MNPSLVCRVLMCWSCCQVLIWDLRCWNNEERRQSDSSQSLELSEREHSVPYTSIIKPLQELVGHEGSIYRISWSASGCHIASASDDRRYFYSSISFSSIHGTFLVPMCIVLGLKPIICWLWQCTHLDITFFGCNFFYSWPSSIWAWRTPLGLPYCWSCEHSLSSDLSKLQDLSC